MKRINATFATLLLCLFVMLAGCTQEAPITGRRQLALIPSGQLNNMSAAQYNGFLNENKTVTGTAQAAMVKRCGQRVQSAVERYMAQENMSDRLDGYDWRFELVENEQVNAWAMPGGRVVVYTGMLDVAKTETELAVVMGHEIAHAVAEHGRERMSQQLLVSLGGLALSQAVKDQPAKTKALFMGAYGAGSTVGVLLPYSRLQENESDELGLYFMAMAGYDPHAAPKFWNAMREKKGGSGPPEFLSTHPADSTRIKNLNALVPKAMKYYKK